MFSNKRSTTRSQCKLPLLLASMHPDNFHEVVASNISQGGMCLEFCNRINHDTPLYIKSFSPVLNRTDSAEGEAFVAKVRWNRKKGVAYGFDVGIQHMTHCQFLDRITGYCDRTFCDMCGDSIKKSLHKTEEDLHLCTNCFWNIGTLGKSVVQSSVIRFLSGNVF
ncbi:MAG: PilZ domain-containing protein [Desulfamplus sp.]|nr:PilZ domain-containing protein [Desulfamplus sp.]